MSINIAVYGMIVGIIKREKASEITFRSPKWMAGAEGLEPSARGFGEKTEKHTNLSCFNKCGTPSREVADDSTTN
jgi:hypothetical protein